MSPKLTKFVDSLPIPEMLKPVKKDNNGTHYEVTMEEFHQKLHRDLPPTRLWGIMVSFRGQPLKLIKTNLFKSNG